jgi:hypothetical protein
MATPWFRLWGDMVNDPKFRTIARVSGQEISRVISVYLHMMTCASNATERGRTEGWCDEDVATALDIDTADVSAIREAMQGRVLDGDYLTGWEKRQPLKEDNSAERAKAWREAKKAEQEQQQTQPNETERSRTQEERRVDTDKKQSKPKATAQPSAALPDWIPSASWAGYIEMRKKKRKEPTARAIELLVAELAKLKDAGQDIGTVLDKSTVNGWTDVYAIKADQQPRGSPAGSQLGRAGQATAANAQRLLEKMRRENEQAG